MNEHDPGPLKQQDALPDSLREALEALGRDHDAPRLARIAERMGVLMDAPPPPMPYAARLVRFAARQATAGKMAVLLLGAGAGVLWYATAPSQPTPRGRAPVLAPPAQPAVSQPMRPADAPDASPELPEVQPAPLPAGPAEVRAQRGSVRPVRSGATRPSSTPEPATQPALDSVPVEGAGAVQADSDRAHRDQKPPEQPLNGRAEPEPRVLSEAELLFEARKLLASDPRAALVLLDRHAAKHPRGMLAPEREVLAIDALRRLGRGQAAEQRVRQFRTNYPDSLHRKALEP